MTGLLKYLVLTHTRLRLKRLLAYRGIGHGISLFGLIAFLVLGSSVAKSSAQINAPTVTVIDSSQNGWLQLKTDGLIHNIWIDSVQVSMNLNGLFQLPAGEHFIRISGVGLINYFQRDATATVQVLPADTIELEIVLPRYNMIYSEPYPAEVWVDGKMLGCTPFLLSINPSAQCSITLKKSGYQDSTISEMGDETSAIWIHLRKDLGDFRRQNDLLLLKNKQRKHQAELTIFSFGLTLASGSAAYLFKTEANRSYERYQRAGNLEKIDHYYNLTQRYDQLAAGSYLFFEVNLLASAYLFFRYVIKP